MTLSPRFVEPLIALSVLIVAVDAIARPLAKPRMAMAFGFGLVYGLGLSNVLRALGLSGRELFPALLGFNVGVEIGSLQSLPRYFFSCWASESARWRLRARATLCAWPWLQPLQSGSSRAFAARFSRNRRICTQRSPELLVTPCATCMPHPPSPSHHREPFSVSRRLRTRLLV